jgi:hypothetical protein
MLVAAAIIDVMPRIAIALGEFQNEGPSGVTGTGVLVRRS